MIIKNEKKSVSLIVSSFFILTLFLFIPIHLFFSNILNTLFHTTFPVILTYSLCISLVLILVFYKLLLFIPDVFFKKTLTAFFTLSFLSWFYGNILIWDYHVFNGVPIQWEKLHHRSLVDAIIIISAFILLAKRHLLIYKFSRIISLFLIAVQFISAIPAIFLSPIPIGYNYYIDSTNKFNFSKKENIIILVLDSFQSDIFHEIINKDPGYRKTFKGFTYFPNITGGFPSTFYSIPLILTGKYYDNSISKTEFLKTSLTSDSSVPKVLKQNGFLVEVCVNKLYFVAEEFASNFSKLNRANKKLFNKDIVHDLVQLYDVTIFRTLPHFLKKYSFDNNSFLIQKLMDCDLFELYRKKADKEKNDKALNIDYVRFISQIKKNITVNSLKPTFKYYHFHGLHSPLRLNENAKYEELPENRNSYLSSAKGLLKLTDSFFQLLKENNIYETTMIFVIADTGLNDLEPQIPESGYTDTFSDNGLKNFHIGSALPLMLVKPFHSSSKFKVSDAPVSLSDINATIFLELRIQAAKEGRSLFDIKETDNITRKYFEHDWGRAEQNSEYFKNMTEYEINGFSWLRSSWKKIK